MRSLPDRWFVTFTFNPEVHPLRKPETYVIGTGKGVDGSAITMGEDSWKIMNYVKDDSASPVEICEYVFDRYELTGIHISQER